MIEHLSVAIPRLVTPRLVLRAYRRDDFPAYTANSADAVATEFVGGVVDARMAWRSFCAGIGGWSLGTGGWLAVALAESDQMVGHVGAFRRVHAPEVVELGWTIFKDHWRKGYAVEAARAMVDFAFQELNEDRVVAYVKPQNEASIRVAQALGMRFTGEQPLYGELCNHYVLERA